MIFNMSGGGVPLNFKVVGGTSQPSSPAANTIWVNTSTAINGWEFIATKPTWTATAGYVYFVAETSTNNKSADFNALKSNGIWINPFNAWQYVNGAWVQKTAKIYKNGAWVALYNGELYESGNEHTDITGGWDGYGLTKNSNELVLSPYSNNRGVAWTNNFIDLSSYKTIKATITGETSSDGSTVFALMISTNQKAIDSDTGVIAKLALATSHSYVNETISLSIPSGLPATYYIKLFIYDWKGRVLKTSKVWLEK